MARKQKRIKLIVAHGNLQRIEPSNQNLAKGISEFPPLIDFEFMDQTKFYSAARRNARKLAQGIDSNTILYIHSGYNIGDMGYAGVEAATELRKATAEPTIVLQITHFPGGIKKVSGECEAFIALASLNDINGKDFVSEDQWAFFDYHRIPPHKETPVLLFGDIVWKMMQDLYQPDIKLILCYDEKGNIDGRSKEKAREAAEQALAAASLNYLVRTMSEPLFAGRAEGLFPGEIPGFEKGTSLGKDILLHNALDERTIVYLSSGKIAYKKPGLASGEIKTTGASAIDSLVENDCRAAFVLQGARTQKGNVYVAQNYSSFLEGRSQASLVPLAQRLSGK